MTKTEETNPVVDAITESGGKLLTVHLSTGYQFDGIFDSLSECKKVVTFRTDRGSTAVGAGNIAAVEVSG